MNQKDLIKRDLKLAEELLEHCPPTQLGHVRQELTYVLEDLMDAAFGPDDIPFDEEDEALFDDDEFINDNPW